MKLVFKVKDVFFSAHLLLGLATGLNFQFSPSPLLNTQPHPINLVTQVSSKKLDGYFTRAWSHSCELLTPRKVTKLQCCKKRYCQLAVKCYKELENNLKLPCFPQQLPVRYKLPEPRFAIKGKLLCYLSNAILYRTDLNSSEPRYYLLISVLSDLVTCLFIFKSEETKMILYPYILSLVKRDIYTLGSQI